MMNNRNISVYVCYHKKGPYISSPLFKYIFCGSAINDPADYMPNTIKDNTGLNISHLNQHFSEVSGIFWAWKNDHLSDYIGLMHYRRFINFFEQPDAGSEDKSSAVNLDQAIYSLCSKYDLVLPKIYSDQKSIYEHYAVFHKLECYDLAMNILKEEYPHLTSIAERLNVGHSIYAWNMFLMNRFLFNEYCTFLFNILFKTHILIDYSVFDEFDKTNPRYVGLRAPAYIAERLSSIYFHYLIEKRYVKYREMPLLTEQLMHEYISKKQMVINN